MIYLNLPKQLKDQLLHLTGVLLTKYSGYSKDNLLKHFTEDVFSKVQRRANSRGAFDKKVGKWLKMLREGSPKAVSKAYSEKQVNQI